MCVDGLTWGDTWILGHLCGCSADAWLHQLPPPLRGAALESTMLAVLSTCFPWETGRQDLYRVL